MSAPWSGMQQVDAHGKKAMAYCSLAFGCYLALSSMFRMEGTGFDDATVTVSRFVSILTMAAFAFFFDRDLPPLSKMFRLGCVFEALFVACSLGLMLGAELGPFQGAFPMQRLVGVFSGLVEGTFIPLVIIMVAGFTPRYSSLMVTVGYLLLNLIVSGPLLIPESLEPLFGTAVLAIGTACVACAVRQVASTAFASEEIRSWATTASDCAGTPLAIRGRPSQPLAAFVASMAVFLFLSGFDVRLVTLGGVPMGPHNALFQIAAIVASCALAAIALWRGINVGADTTVLLAAPLFSVAYILMALFAGSNLLVVGLIAKIGYTVFQTLFWIILARIAFADVRSSLVYIAIFYGTMKLSAILGQSFAEALGYPLEPSVASIVALVALSLILVLCLVLLMGRTSAKRELGMEVPIGNRVEDAGIEQTNTTLDTTADIATGARGAVAAPTKNQLFANRYGLSDREAQVLEHLVKGYNMASIADLLGLSGSTVRTYVRRIYTKTTCEFKQELVELYDSFS